MKILIISDDTTVADATIGGLANLQYEIHYADDGEAGLGFATEGKFDLIVLDWTPGKISGLEILKRLRAQNPGPGPHGGCRGLGENHRRIARLRRQRLCEETV